MLQLKEHPLPKPPTEGGHHSAGRRAASSFAPLFIADVIGLIVAMVIGAIVRPVLMGPNEGPVTIIGSLTHEVPYLPGFLLAMSAYGLYRRIRRRMLPSSFPDLAHFLHGLLTGSIIALLVSGFLRTIAGAPRLGWIEVTFIAVPAIVLLPGLRALAAALVRRRGSVRSRVVVVGSGSSAVGITSRLRRSRDIELVGLIDDGVSDAPSSINLPHLGAIRDLPRACSALNVDRVVITFGSEHQAQLVEVLRELPRGVTVSMVTRLYELVTWQSQIEDVHGLALMDIPSAQLGWHQRAAKRAMDITVSASALIALSLPLLVIALAVKATSRGPVFFRQERVGKHGSIFRIIKFRTMADGASDLIVDLRDHTDTDGGLFKLHADPRVTKVGRLLRTTSLDEVPQLINVLRGEMSLVGPRPFVPCESAGLDGWAARRFEVRPGMTGLWQISGRSDLPFDELRQLDYAYVASWSLWWDLRIMWHTPGTALSGHGAY